MADLWLPNAAHHLYPLRGGSYDRLSPKKILLHTTEGTTIAGALGAYGSYPPHLIASYKERKVVQHVPLNKRAYSLKASEAEDEPVIQVEIVGFARQARYWSKQELDWLIDNVMLPVWRLWPYDLAVPPQGFKDELDGVLLASSTSKHRMSMTDFVNFSGIVGHQHAPAPDSHWDPGAIDTDYIISELGRKIRPNEPEKQVAEPKPESISRITSWYEFVMGRKGDNEGIKFWATQLDTAGWNAALDGMASSFEAKFAQFVRTYETWMEAKANGSKLDKIIAELKLVREDIKILRTMIEVTRESGTSVGGGQYTVDIPETITFKRIDND